MKLSHVANKILLSDIKTLVANERQQTLKILFHLKEIDQRKLFSDLKYPSLFSYCVKELGYSESAAQRRIVAARLLHQIPETASKIEKGHLTLTNIAMVAETTKIKDERKVLLGEVENLTKKECEKKIFELTDKKIKSEDSFKRISPTQTKIAIVLNDETVKKLEKLKELMSAKDLDHVISAAIDSTIKDIEQKKFKQVKRPRTSPPPAEVGRYVSSSIKREIYKRDKKCTNCGSSRNLHYDHRVPYALGGKSTSENIRLLCSNCNQRARIRAGLNTGLSGVEPMCRPPPP